MGIFDEADIISCIWCSCRPVVPITIAILKLTASWTFWAVEEGLVKSIRQSAVCIEDRHLSVTLIFFSPTPTSAPTSLPIS